MAHPMFASHANLPANLVQGLLTLSALLVQMENSFTMEFAIQLVHYNISSLKQALKHASHANLVVWNAMIQLILPALNVI